MAGMFILRFGPMLLGFLVGTGLAVAAEPIRERLVVMTFNTWHDGGRVDDGFEKIVTEIVRSGADVVGLQEAGAETARKIAVRLGWHHAEGGTGSVQIVSRHRVESSFILKGIEADRFIGIRMVIEADPRREIVIGNLHLDHEFYGPYAAAKPGADLEDVLAENARSERMKQLRAVLEGLESYLKEADGVPVVLTGDFNAPSHLDWAEEAAAARRGLPAVPWQESLALSEAGWVDSFRTCHPDPLAVHGNTWSTVHKGTEPQDRIDFIYHFGDGLVPVESCIYPAETEVTVGVWGEDTAVVRGNAWPSDHASVITTYHFKSDSTK